MDLDLLRDAMDEYEQALEVVLTTGEMPHPMLPSRRLQRLSTARFNLEDALHTALSNIREEMKFE